MESEHESESKDANNSRNEDEELSPIISVKMKSEKTSGSSEKSNSSHSASSSSESSSDFFQIDAKLPQKSCTFPVITPETQEGSQSPEKREKNDTPGDLSSNSENLGEKSPFGLSSQVSCATNESTLQMASPVQSPPIQVMEKIGGYDPDRIPDSVFGRFSSAAMDWSVASNESLFSLHFGNNSFSREQFLMMSGDLYNSGELNKPDETVKSGRPPLFPVGKVQKEEDMNSDKQPEQTKAADETMEDSSELDFSDKLEEKETEVEVNGHSSMISRPSDASGTSTQSFAFPILVDTAKSDSVKGPSPRQRDVKPVVYYVDSPRVKAHAKSSSIYWGCCCCYNCCSLPQWSCPSYQHCWSWNWCQKWFCCSCC